MKITERGGVEEGKCVWFEKTKENDGRKDR
jgi:hypothetical protein